MKRLSWLIICTLLLTLSARLARADGKETLQTINLIVDSVERTALVYAPSLAKSEPTPLVFVFHGHGGSASQAERSFGIDRYWPAVISVYPQGLPTPGQLTDREGKLAGWQKGEGDQNNRDLKFFDALLACLKQNYQVDSHRIYVTGHSNGGGFTYLLWLTRGDAFAAVAPSAAAARYARQLKPKPAMLLAGENDKLVKFTWQKSMMDVLRQVNGCDPTGQPWDKYSTIYPSKTGTPLITFIHPGGHEMDSAAAPEIVKFFQSQTKP